MIYSVILVHKKIPIHTNYTCQKWPDPNDLNWNTTWTDIRDNWSKVHLNRKWLVSNQILPKHFLSKSFSF